MCVPALASAGRKPGALYRPGWQFFYRGRLKKGAYFTEHAHAPDQVTPLMRVAGLAEPVVVISYNPGCAHSDSEYTFFSVGGKFAPVAKVSEFSLTFMDVNNDGVCEILGYDRTFTYWHASYAESYIL